MVSLLGFLFSLIYAKVGAHVAVISKTPKGIKKKKNHKRLLPLFKGPGGAGQSGKTEKCS